MTDADGTKVSIHAYFFFVGVERLIIFFCLYTLSSFNIVMHDCNK